MISSPRVTVTPTAALVNRPRAHIALSSTGDDRPYLAGFTYHGDGVWHLYLSEGVDLDRAGMAALRDEIDAVLAVHADWTSPGAEKQL